MFLSFYKLREQPFGVTPDPRFLYESEVHKATLASLLYGIQSDLGFAALFAEPGMGKTTLLFRILERFRSTALTAFIFQTQCSSRDMLKHLLRELDVEAPDNDPVTLHQQIQQVLANAARTGRRVVLIVDEAQNLDVSVLETVRLLSNFETPQSKLLHTILSGQPHLATLLARPELAQLQQRIAITSHLNPLTPDEVTLYIDHRLRVGGLTGDSPFTDSALETIAGWSSGIPRKINRVCFNALTIGCSLGKTQIDKEIVEKAVSDFSAHAWTAAQAARLGAPNVSDDGSTYRIFLPLRGNSWGPQRPDSANFPKLANSQAADSVAQELRPSPGISYGEKHSISAIGNGLEAPDLSSRPHPFSLRRGTFPIRVGVRIRLTVPGSWKSVLRWKGWFSHRPMDQPRRSRAAIKS